MTNLERLPKLCERKDIIVRRMQALKKKLALLEREIIHAALFPKEKVAK